jgi:hypothetical protein
MPLDVALIPQRLIEAARHRILIPLVGAGVSKQAGPHFPDWDELLIYMRDKAVTSSFLKDVDGQEIERLIRSGKTLMAAEALRKSLPPDEYNSILEEKFNPPGVTPAEIHKALFRLRPPMILTTNYDRLLEDAYAEEYHRAAQVLTYKDAVTAQRYLQSGRYKNDRPSIFKIHGTIDDPENIILTEIDYRELIYRQPGYRVFTSAIFLTHVVLMLGFSFTDPELRLLLEELRESLKHQGHPDYLFFPITTAGDVEIRRLREDFGIHVIPYTPSPGHPEVLELVEFLINQMHATP